MAKIQVYIIERHLIPATVSSIHATLSWERWIGLSHQHTLTQTRVRGELTVQRPSPVTTTSSPTIDPQLEVVHHRVLHKIHDARDDFVHLYCTTGKYDTGISLRLKV